MAAPAEQPHYLLACLEEFPEICKKKYGMVFDLRAVEKKVKRLRRKTELTYEDLAYFESPEHWWFQRFWVFPPESCVAPALKGMTFDFWNVTKENEAGLIRQLLYAFKSIELASIILRFVRPDNYAIFSSPIERLLDIRRGREPVETYRNYLGDLREIHAHYGFSRIADVDMALWVLHEKCFGTYRDPGFEKAFRRDTFFLRLRAKNLVAPLAMLSDSQLANALTDVKPDLAVLVACHALEIMIRRLAAHYGLPSIGPGLALEQVIDSLPNYGLSGAIRKGKWKMLKDARNEFVHAGTSFGVRERTLLIEEVLRLEKDLGAAGIENQPLLP